MLYYKKYYFLIFWVLSELLYSQQNQKELDVNLLLKRSDSYIYVDFEKSLKLSKTALAKAEKLNNSQKRSESYLYVAKSLIFFRRFDECFPYLEKGIQEKASQKDIILKASFLSLQASYYSRMSLPNRPIEGLMKCCIC
ncbi:hypothetical protein QWZ06_09300 [Chryseobacterium tructae]|uniref:hypothetical protein n=1 Tax=Chryseobacterium tructae TaxID=1037380 RepID=UPI0025B59AAE|nr:hypothetical protein [Chryseobacterium tructae]MDN3692454.1 hypothetical protein [Chryseobacterium tructae]